MAYDFEKDIAMTNMIKKVVHLFGRVQNNVRMINVSYLENPREYIVESKIILESIQFSSYIGYNLGWPLLLETIFELLRNSCISLPQLNFLRNSSRKFIIFRFITSKFKSALSNIVSRTPSPKL